MVKTKDKARKDLLCLSITNMFSQQEVVYLETQLPRIHFPSQSLKKFTFRVKLSDSIFFLLGLSPIVKKFDMKSKYF